MLQPQTLKSRYAQALSSVQAEDYVRAPLSVEPHHVEFWSREESQASVQTDPILEKSAWKQVRSVAKLLKQQFGVSQIMVFGSLVRGRFHADSDIDIAVTGLAGKDFFTALSQVNDDLEAVHRIDLKLFDDLDAHFRKRVLETGKLLDETF